MEISWAFYRKQKNRKAKDNSQHSQRNTLPGQQRHASDKPFRCLQCPPDFQLVSKETCCVPESIHQIRPERKQCENPWLSSETCRQVITEKVSLALEHPGSGTHTSLFEERPNPPFSSVRPGLKGENTRSGQRSTSALCYSKEACSTFIHTMVIMRVALGIGEQSGSGVEITVGL